MIQRKKKRRKKNQKSKKNKKNKSKIKTDKALLQNKKYIYK